MATTVNLTMREGNDETITFEITPAYVGDDLTATSEVRVIIKPSVCDSDDSPYALILNTPNATEVVLLTQTATSITGEAYVPGTWLAEPYDRVYRIDAVSAGSPEGRTAIHGSITVTDL